MKRLYLAIKELLPVLPAGTNRFMLIYVVSTSALALLDLFALGLLAAILTPMLTGDAASVPLLGQIPASYYGPLLLVACALMILKGVLALVIQWFATRTFSRYELQVGDALFNAYIRSPWTDRLARSTSQIVRLADVGIANTIAGVLMPAISLPQQVATFVVVLTVLFIAQPSIAAITLVYLGIIAAFQYFGLSRSLVTAGNVNMRYSMKITRLMTEMVAAMKEIALRDQFSDVAKVVRENRERSTRARANLQFLTSVPQRLMEAALVFGFVLIGTISYLLYGPEQAFASIALFGIAGMRMVPSLVTFQSVMTTTANTLPHLEAVMRDIHAADGYVARAEQVGKEPLEDNPGEVVLDGVSFTYPGAPEPAVRDINLTIPIGSSLGIVGSSGAGKSTLVDILLGLLVPSQGSMMIGSKELPDVLQAWRSRVGYVPQEVALFDATIAQNIALTWGEDIDEERVLWALERAQLGKMVAERPGGIHARIGERGIALSGGERQRLGIARALYNRPLVLVMDEATSALDTATEEAVSQAIRELHGEVTVISIAHRLSTIRHNDQIAFMRAGQITATGTFEELVEKEPDFAIQAHLAGLV